MGNYELDDEDVLSLPPGLPFLEETTTVKVDQMKAALIKKFITFANNNSSARVWLDQGFKCKLLSATQGCGWKTGRIRLRVEIELEPEPEPEPKPVNDASDSLDTLRTELYPKQ